MYHFLSTASPACPAVHQRKVTKQVGNPPRTKQFTGAAWTGAADHKTLSKQPLCEEVLKQPVAATFP